MTEILEKIERRMRARDAARAAQPSYIIDPVAFFVALIGGPLLVTAISFWLAFVPVFALGFGGPFYLLIGTPVLLWYLRRNKGDTDAIIGLAFLANLAIFALGSAATAMSGDQDMLGATLFFAGFGMIFAPAWGWGFGFLYNRLRREFYTHPQFI